MSADGNGPRLVLFDCDGTIVDSQHMIVAAMGDAFAANGLEAPVPAATRSIIGLSMHHALATLTPGLDDDAIDRLAGAYRDAFLARVQVDEEPVFEGALATIAELAGRENVLLGIATGKSRRGVDRLMERTGTAHVFATLQTADDAPSKPHPGMIVRALEETGADARFTAMIGDTSFDMEMAVNAGVHAVGVSWGYHDDDVLRAAGAECVAGQFDELADVLDTLWDGDKAAETAGRQS